MSGLPIASLILRSPVVLVMTAHMVASLPVPAVVGTVIKGRPGFLTL
jgi:hypothetical protein